MGIIEDFLKPKAEAPAIKGSGIIERFLNPTPEDTSISSRRTVPSGPISGTEIGTSYSTPEETAARGKATEEYLKNKKSDFPNPAGIILDKAAEGIKTAGEGVGDIFSNKPATGFGKVGSGLLGTAFSIPTGTGEFIDKTIGKPEGGAASFGDKAALLVGGAAPVKLGVRTINKLPKNEAFRKLVEDIGPENAGYVAKEMRSNPNLTPADLAPSVRMGVQRLHANVEGPQVSYIEGVAKNRLANAADDLERHMDANLGKVVDPVKKLEELKSNIREVGKEHIEPALKGSKPVDLSETIKKIDDVLKPGINSKITQDTVIADPKLEEQLIYLRKHLTDDKSVRIDPEQLNRLQSAFRKKAEMMEKSDPYTAGAIKGIRNSIVDAIDKATGGKYKPALEKYRDEFHIQDAFDYGHDTILKNGRNLSDRPEFFEQWVKSATSNELQAAKEGARIAYDTQMNGFKHAARRGTDIGDVEFNKRRMSALFGKEEADNMFKLFEQAKKVAETNNKLAQGSQSRIQNAQGTYFEPHDPKKAGSLTDAAVKVGVPLAAEAAGQLFAGSMGGSVLAGGAMVGGKIAGNAIAAARNNIIKKVEDSRNLSYAKMALPVEPVSREKLIQQLEAVANSYTPSKPSLLNRTAMKTTKILPP